MGPRLKASGKQLWGWLYLRHPDECSLRFSSTEKVSLPHPWVKPMGVCSGVKVRPATGTLNLARRESLKSWGISSAVTITLWASWMQASNLNSASFPLHLITKSDSLFQVLLKWALSTASFQSGHSQSCYIQGQNTWWASSYPPCQLRWNPEYMSSTSSRSTFRLAPRPMKAWPTAKGHHGQ